MQQNQETGSHQKSPSPSAHVTVQALEECVESDIEAGEIIPTIELTEEAEVCAIRKITKKKSSLAKNKKKNDYDDENDDTGVPPARSSRSKQQCLPTSAVAFPVGSLLSRDPVPDDYSRNLGFRRRAEFISASLIKPDKSTELGLSFKGGEKGLVIISRIKPSGLIAESHAPFQLGDKLVSVNNISCDKMDHKKAAKILRNATGTIIIVVQNTGGDGDAQLVETLIQKPSPNYQAGIGFSSTPESLSPQVNVSCILLDGLFGQSLLSIGDEILSINGTPCRQLDPTATAGIIRSADKYVTVVAKKFQGNGVVIAAAGLSMNRLTSGTPARQRHYEMAFQMLLCLTFFIAMIVLILYVKFN